MLHQPQVEVRPFQQQRAWLNESRKFRRRCGKGEADVQAFGKAWRRLQNRHALRMSNGDGRTPVSSKGGREKGINFYIGELGGREVLVCEERRRPGRFLHGTDMISCAGRQSLDFRLAVPWNGCSQHRFRGSPFCREGLLVEGRRNAVLPEMLYRLPLVQEPSKGEPRNWHSKGLPDVAGMCGRKDHRHHLRS